jgi:hypothetical protein
VPSCFGVDAQPRETSNAKAIKNAEKYFSCFMSISQIKINIKSHLTHDAVLHSLLFPANSLVIKSGDHNRPISNRMTTTTNISPIPPLGP